jgi:hypothetical protein
MRAVIAIILAFAITANCGLLKKAQEAAPMLSLVQVIFFVTISHII